MRNKLILANDKEDEKNIALYFLKIFGCLLVEKNIRINGYDFLRLRNSVLYGDVLVDNVFLSFHRDLEKQLVKDSETIANHPVISKLFIGWMIDLDWISLVITYPCPASSKWGTYWRLGSQAKALKLGKLY
jgi:hypothetical protein